MGISLDCLFLVHIVVGIAFVTSICQSDIPVPPGPGGMLLDLCEISISRQWPPEVFLRLCNQLSDSTDLFEDHSEALIDYTIAHPYSPLLMEYVLVLSCNPNSIVPALSLLQRWASQNWKDRADEERGLIAYIARGVQLWQLKPSSEELDPIFDSLVTQSLDGCVELRFLLTKMGQCGLASQVVRCNPSSSWIMKLKEAIKHNPSIFPNFEVSFQDLVDGKAPERDIAVPTTSQVTESYRPSRTFRLLWLDWVATASGLGTSDEAMKSMVELLWPGDLPQVVAYELCVTAFDVFASCIQEQQQPPAVQAAEEIYQQQQADRRDRRHFLAAFITRRLPILLERLVGTNIDGTLARVFTTMDKTLSQVVDGFGSDIRTEFGRACVDIGLCDPTVLHVLHKSHVPRIDNGVTVLNDLPIDSLATALRSPNQRFGQSSFAAQIVKHLPELGPRSLRAVSQHLLKFAQTPSKSIHPLSLLCYALITESEHADLIFVNAPLHHFLHAIFCHCDIASKQKPSLNDGSVYVDIGVMLIFAETMAQRYREQLDNYTGWAAETLSHRNQISSGDLNPSENKLLGDWIEGLFGGNGISDGLLRPANDLFRILPALLQQSAVAYRSAVIDRDTLRSGLENFVKPLFLPLLGPVILQILKNEIIHAVHVDAVLEMTHILITALLQAKDDHTTVAKLSAGNRLREIIRLAHPDSQSGRIIHQSLVQLSTQLPTSLYPSLANHSPFTGSIVEAVKGALKELTVWQSRPAGAPMVNSAVLRLAARTIGPRSLRQIIESCCPGNFNKVAIAVTVIISISCYDNADALINCKGEFEIGAVALAFYEKLKAISDNNAVAPGLGPSKEGEQNPEPMDIEPEGNINSSKDQNGTEMGANPNSALDDLGYDMDLDAQSVDLADLDNAMDLNWM